MRVLIVEDDVFVGLLVEDQLNEDGHDIVGRVSSASAARDLLAHSRPDVMLVDINLDDGETGCVLAHEVREQLNIPTIFMTGSPAKARECDDALGVLVKPFSPESVTAALDAAAIIKAGGKPAHPPAGLELF
jgi:two-component system, response regulator PdtaR